MSPRLALSFGNFFSSAHFFIIIYILGPYLTAFLPDSETGLVVSAGALLTLISFPFMPRLVVRYGARTLALILAALEAVILLLLAQEPSAAIAITCVALACAISPLIAYQLDLLLEATVAEEGVTGRIRTAFLTAGNLALIIAPFLIGVLLDGTNEYWRVFLAASISLTPFLTLFLIEKVPEGTPPLLGNIWTTCLCVFADRDLRAIAIANAVLQIFDHLAPLYIPLYLHTALGMPWSQLGWMFVVMLLPFPLLEYPAGIIADRWLGDKELLVFGFTLTGISLAAIGFITNATPLLTVLAILVLSRVGVALAEAMVEGHFFRRVSERDATTVGVFRIMRPIAALTAPIAASLVLGFSNYLVLFVATGAVILVFGVGSALKIDDIR